MGRAHGVRLCGKCERLKSGREFSFANREQDRKHPWCRECYRVYNAERKERMEKGLPPRKRGRRKGDPIPLVLVQKRKKAKPNLTAFALELKVTRQFLSAIETKVSSCPKWILQKYEELAS